MWHEISVKMSMNERIWCIIHSKFSLHALLHITCQLQVRGRTFIKAYKNPEDI